MQEELNCKISELVDHELPIDEALNFMDKVDEFPDLEKKMHRYQTVSQALKYDQVIFSETDFVNRIKQDLNKEPVYLIRRKQPKSRYYQVVSALAASLAIMSIIIYGGMSNPVNDKLPVLTMAASDTPQYEINDRNESLKKPSKRLNQYLEAHRGSLYTAVSPAYQSYVRLADYGQQ